MPKKQKELLFWIKKLENQELSTLPFKIKHGTKSAMAFIYGVSKETPFGIIHIGYDFNHTKRKEFKVCF